MKRVKGVSWVFRSTNPSCFISLFSPTCVCVTTLSLPFLISSAIPIKSCWNSFWGQGVYSSGTECLSKGPICYTHICMREYYQISSHTCKSIHLYPAPFLIQHSQWGSPAFSICIVCVWLWFVFFPPLHPKKEKRSCSNCFSKTKNSIDILSDDDRYDG